MKMKRILQRLAGRRGSQMTEAAVSLPVIILAAMLMIRLFTFYIEILTAGIKEHREAFDAQDAYTGVLIRTYRDEEKVEMLRGGLLLMDVSKRLETKAYMINEDILARTGGLIE